VCDEKANYIILPLVILTLGVSLWYFNYKPIVANLSLIKSMQPQKEGLAKNIEYFNKALSQDTFADSEILEQLLNVTMKVVSLDVDMKTKEAFVGFTLAQAEKQLKQTPDDARYQFFVGGFLVNLEQYEMALPLLEKAVELSPNKLTMLFELSNCLSHLGQKERSLEIAKKAYDLVPKYNQGKLNYAFALIRNGEEKKAKEILGTETIDNEKIIRAYLLNAADFIKTGNKSSAVLEVQKAMKISPGFEKQGKDVISAIWAGTLK
jgi:tetratricopeptide (TPR) repeat protein